MLQSNMCDSDSEAGSGEERTSVEKMLAEERFVKRHHNLAQKILTKTVVTLRLSLGQIAEMNRKMFLLRRDLDSLL